MRWFPRRRINCASCGRRFPAGTGGGITGSTVCSDKCWQKVWTTWTGRPDK